MTPKQHQFAREVVLGKSQADAYRAAYNTLRMNDNSIRREASRLMNNPNVATTVAELQQKADAAVMQERIASREEVLQTLTSYMHSGEPKDSVRLRAAEMMGKHYGLFTDRIEAVVPARSTEEIAAELEEKLTSLLGTPINLG
ncbi:terminase small subunit [Woeseiaceae bacterium]|nr:terminase small subunit [Woeseiaceae bacterium]